MWHTLRKSDELDDTTIHNPQHPTQTMNTLTNLETIAAAHDAAIITAADGSIALQSRIYDAEGLQQVRHRPDPCDFLPAERWQSMVSDDAARHIC